MPHDVFVSYSVKDKVVADAIVARLEADSIRCWVAPRDVVPGADWGESIINAIESSRIMVLVFTSSANASPQIKREVERAVDKDVYTIPIRIENIEPTKSLEYFISTSQWMDAFPPPMEAHLDFLAKTVKAILAGRPPPLLSPPPEPPKKPPLPLGRWIVLAAVILLGALGSWYVATHRPPAPGPVAIETPTPPPVPPSRSRRRVFPVRAKQICRRPKKPGKERSAMLS
ncbi:MAG: toll/interleukin-1 receptor domain-containing protein [Chthoniobacterales bacterium]|nr:toll/interleukin-1 receptor domain-containing protein [Chthoniobacterales bacterium]